MDLKSNHPLYLIILHSTVLLKKIEVHGEPCIQCTHNICPRIHMLPCVLNLESIPQTKKSNVIDAISQKSLQSNQYCRSSRLIAYVPANHLSQKKMFQSLIHTTSRHLYCSKIKSFSYFLMPHPLIFNFSNFIIDCFRLIWSKSCSSAFQRWAQKFKLLYFLQEKFSQQEQL